MTGRLQHVGRRGNRGNSLRRAALAGSETQHSSRGNGLGRAHCRAVGAAFSELLARFLQDKCHHCDCPGKIVDARLVKRSQDRSNGFQRLKNGTCTAKRLLLQRVSFCMKPWKKSWEYAEPLARVFRDKLQPRDCPETLCAKIGQTVFKC